MKATLLRKFLMTYLNKGKRFFTLPGFDFTDYEQYFKKQSIDFIGNSWNR